MNVYQGFLLWGAQTFVYYCHYQEETSFGSMLELSWKGSRTVQLKGGAERKFLQVITPDNRLDIWGGGAKGIFLLIWIIWR